MNISSKFGNSSKKMEKAVTPNGVVIKFIKRCMVHYAPFFFGTILKH